MNRTIRNNLFVLQLLFDYSKKYFFVALIIKLLDLYNVLISIFLLKIVLDLVTISGISLLKVVATCLVLCIPIVLIQFIKSWFNNKYLPTFQIGFRKNIHTILYNKMLSLQYSTYDEPDFYNEYTFVMTDSENRFFSVVDSVISFFYSTIQLIVIMATVLFVFDTPSILIFPILTVILTTILFKRANELIFLRNNENLPIIREIDYIKRVFYLRDYAKSLRLTQISNVLRRNLGTSVKKSQTVFNSFAKKILPTSFLLTVVFELFNRFGLLSYLIWKLYTGCISISSFVALYSAADSILSSLQGVTDIVKNFHENDLYIQKFINFYNRTPVKEITEKKEFFLALQKSFTIKFVDVCFKYDFRNQYALNKVSFTINSGEKIAIVGENGAGKTTLINLLLKLYHPLMGKIVVDGKDIDEYSFDSYISYFSVVPQDFNIFATSLAENVKMDEVDSMDNTDIVDALRKVEFGESIYNNDLNVLVTKEFSAEGLELSGGEKQKLALARLFLSPKRILIMDEPSSALDPISEYNIFKRIFKEFQDYTIIFVSHRLYVAGLSDKIVVLDKGEIVEIGGHDELMRNEGKYAELYRATTENYKNIIS